jgi:hypothetical protein
MWWPCDDNGLVSSEGVTVTVESCRDLGWSASIKNTDQYLIVLHNDTDREVVDWMIKFATGSPPIIRTFPRCNERGLDNNVVRAPTIMWLTTDFTHRCHKNVPPHSIVKFNAVVVKDAGPPLEPRAFVKFAS